MKYFAIALLSLFASLAHANDDLYLNKEIGFSIQKPAGWYFLSTQDASESVDGARLGDDELSANTKYKARLPIVTISKYADPSVVEAASPTVKVIMSPISQPGTPEAMVRNVLDQSLSKAKGYEELVAPKKLKVSGLDAAMAEAKFQIENGAGVLFDVKTRIYVIPRGSFVFTVAMSGPLDGPDVSEKEFAAVLRSIQISE